MVYAAIILPVLLSGLTFIILLKVFGKKGCSFPLDFGLKVRNKRIFGKNKTIKGSIVMGFFTGVYGLLLANILKLRVVLNLPALSIFYYYYPKEKKG